MQAFELKTPDTLKGALDLLDPEDPTVRLISGGTALMLMMKSDVFHPTRLVSLRGIEKEYSSMNALPDGSFRIGAMSTMSDMQNEQALYEFVPVLRKTLKTLANVRVRNVATLGGALAHGDPHMDLPPVFAALNAEIVAQCPTGERRIPAEELHVGYYETQLAGDELIKEVIIPSQKGRRSTYLKCTTRAAKDWPALGVAISINGSAEATQDARLVIGSVAERPIRVSEAEAVLNGRALTAEVMREAAEAAADTVETIPDELGSAAYKKQLVRVYVERALQSVADQNAEVSQ